MGREDLNQRNRHHGEAGREWWSPEEGLGPHRSTSTLSWSRLSCGCLPFVCVFMDFRLLACCKNFRDANHFYGLFLQSWKGAKTGDPCTGLASARLPFWHSLISGLVAEPRGINQEVSVSNFMKIVRLRVWCVGKASQTFRVCQVYWGIRR